VPGPGLLSAVDLVNVLYGSSLIHSPLRIVLEINWPYAGNF